MENYNPVDKIGNHKIVIDRKFFLFPYTFNSTA